MHVAEVTLIQVLIQQLEHVAKAFLGQMQGISDEQPFVVEPVLLHPLPDPFWGQGGDVIAVQDREQLVPVDAVTTNRFLENTDALITEADVHSQLVNPLRYCRQYRFGAAEKGLKALGVQNDDAILLDDYIDVVIEREDRRVKLSERSVEKRGEQALAGQLNGVLSPDVDSLFGVGASNDGVTGKVTFPQLRLIGKVEVFASGEFVDKRSVDTIVSLCSEENIGFSISAVWPVVLDGHLTDERVNVRNNLL